MQLYTFLAASFTLLGKASANGAQDFIQYANLQREHQQQLWDDMFTPYKATNTTSYRYLNSNTTQYHVPTLPDFNFDIGETYAGNIPIESSSRTLFFVFKPSTGPAVDEITVWLNGGPGCSSLAGLISENGPWTWEPGTYLPVDNPYAWSNYTNMLWVDQPVGVGFSTGQVRATSQEEIAQDFVKFFKNFQDVFGIKNYNIYMTGESYAGRYVPYISEAFLQQNDTTNFNLKGGMIYDPSIGSAVTQLQSQLAPFVAANQAFLNLNASTLAAVQAADVRCGYNAYRQQYYQFPPPSSQPAVYQFPAGQSPLTCNIFGQVFGAAARVNPCFDIYSINTQCPLLWDVIGFPSGRSFLPKGASIYFNRTDVKSALHAPPDIEWQICVNNVLVNDTSPDSTDRALPTVIEATNRFIIANGDFDMILTTNGTLFSVQNMTWGGKTGLSAPPNQSIIVNEPDLEYGVAGPEGFMGVKTIERGLLFADVRQAGHMVPQAQPRVTLLFLQWMLGRINDF